MKLRLTKAKNNRETSVTRDSEEELHHGAGEEADSEERSNISWTLLTFTLNRTLMRRTKRKARLRKDATKDSEVSARRDKSGERREQLL